MSLYDAVSDLSLAVEDCAFDRREQDTSSGFTRATTVVRLSGDGETGLGEDVTYDAAEHDALVGREPPIEPGAYTLASFSEFLDETDLFYGREPEQPSFRNYRRWAFESAALDLALRQADADLGSLLGREYDPVRFVVSTRLGDEPSADRVETWLDIDPSLEFKLDPTSDWSADLVADLAATDRVRILDLKGLYRGTEVDQTADADLYERVVEGFPDAIVEDPALTEETRPVFAGRERRVSWDYPITGVESVEELPFEPSWLNVKPSRFGSVERLFDTLDYCAANDIACYGGGQFELDVGREQLQALASLFYPDAPNDVAPRAYNRPEPSAGLPASPLSPPEAPTGFRWS